MKSRTKDPELLSTGQAAVLLGTTLQHVVNLCERGELPHQFVGSHRRIRRSDIMAVKDRATSSKAGGPMTDDQVRSLWLHRAATGHVAKDPFGSLEYARTFIERLLRKDPDGARWLRDWLTHIARGPEAVMRVMTSTDPAARELRQNSPFLGLLGEEERLSVLRAYQDARSFGRHR